ncbi:MAG: aspartyl protease family protein [Bacteroidia bacterium]
MKKIPKSLNNWTNENREHIRKYMGNYIAYNETGVIAYAKTLKALSTKADKITKDYLYYYVSPLMDKVRILPIHFRTMKVNEWQPDYPVILQAGKRHIELPMLIDSGADCSVISNQTGLKLGLKLAPNETLTKAFGVGTSSVMYVGRDIDITIDSKKITVPVAWLQDNDSTDEIIGREIVFDKFDIEFKQANKKIIFKWRG